MQESFKEAPLLLYYIVGMVSLRLSDCTVQNPIPTWAIWGPDGSKHILEDGKAVYNKTVTHTKSKRQYFLCSFFVNHHTVSSVTADLQLAKSD